MNLLQLLSGDFQKLDIFSPVRQFRVGEDDFLSGIFHKNFFFGAPELGFMKALFGFDITVELCTATISTAPGIRRPVWFLGKGKVLLIVTFPNYFT